MTVNNARSLLFRLVKTQNTARNTVKWYSSLVELIQEARSRSTPNNTKLWRVRQRFV